MCSAVANASAATTRTSTAITATYRSPLGVNSCLATGATRNTRSSRSSRRARSSRTPCSDANTNGGVSTTITTSSACERAQARRESTIDSITTTSIANISHVAAPSHKPISCSMP